MGKPSGADDFVKLLTRYEPQIHGCALMWVPNWNDAQDVTPQVSVALWRKFEEYDPARSLLAWAVGIAKLEARDDRRRKARERQVFGERFVDLVAAEAMPGPPQAGRPGTVVAAVPI